MDSEEMAYYEAANRRIKGFEALTTNDKINLKQYALNLSGNKQMHFRRPDELKKLNCIEINYGLSDFAASNTRKYQVINGTRFNLTNRI